MAEIFDLFAKISWDTNSKELEHTIDLSREQSKMLEELRLKGRRLEEQIVKTNDPVKLKKYNDELQETAKRANAITAAQKKQADSVEDLKKKQKDFIELLKKANDPKAVQGLLRGLHQVENQLTFINRQATALPAKVGGIGRDLITGITGGFVGGGIVGATQMAFGAISNFIGNSTAEYEDAEKTALNLNRTLKVIGRTKYFDGIMSESDELASKFHNLFDNDEIIKAQTALVNYGKLSRNEISKLTPVILELATAERIDLAQATEKVINIIEGRGGQTLRDYGVSVKGLKTEHERLNVVLGDFQTKLKGSADTYAQTADGIDQANAVMIANIEERFGAAFSSIGKSFKKLLLPVLESIAGFLETQDEKNARSEKGVENLVKNLISDKSIPKELIEKRIAQRQREVDMLQKAIDANDATIAEKLSVKASMDARKRNEWMVQELINRRGELNALKGVIKDKDADKAMNPNANLAEEKEKKAAVKKVKLAKQTKVDLDKIKEDEFRQTLVFLDEYNEAQLLKLQILLNDKKITEKEYQDRVLDQDIEFYRNKITAYEDYGKNTSKLQIELLKKFEQNNKRQRESPKGVTGEFMPGTQGDIQLTDFTSAFASDPEITAAKKKEAEITKAKKDAIKERNRLGREELLYNSQSLANEIGHILSMEQYRTEKSISLQEKRIDEAKKSSTASVKLEEDRLNMLLEKRQKYERAQRVIDAGVILANQAVAISAAIVGIANAVKDGNALLVAANVVAVLAGLTAGYAAVRSINADQGFYEGGYTGDGDPKSISTAQGNRGYKYHKKEFVMNAELTDKHRDMFEGIHKGDLMVKQIGDGYYLAPSVDVDKSVSDHNAAKALSSPELAAMAYELAGIKTLLSQRELTVNNKFDADGFGQAVAGQLVAAHIKNLMR